MENWIYWSFGGTCDSKISAKFHKRDGSNAKRPIIIDLKYIADFKMVKKTIQSHGEMYDDHSDVTEKFLGQYLSI